MATVYGHRVVESGLAGHLVLVSGICEPSVGLHENGWAEVLLRVPPVGWARCRAASAQNALVKTIQLLAVLLALQVLLTLFIC